MMIEMIMEYNFHTMKFIGIAYGSLIININFGGQDFAFAHQNIKDNLFLTTTATTTPKSIPNRFCLLLVSLVARPTCDMISTG